MRAGASFLASPNAALRAPLRVGIDVSVLGMPQVAGRRLYLQSLLQEILPHSAVEWVLLYGGCERRCVEAALPSGSLKSGSVTLQPFPLLAGWFNRGLWALPVPAPPLPRSLGLDVYHVGEFYFPCSLGGAIGVATVHDLTTVVLPWSHPPQGRWRDRRQLAWIRRHAERCAAVSHATAEDLVHLGGVSAERINVVPEAPTLNAPPMAWPELRARFDLEDAPFVLHVGTLEPRKNLVRLIRAFEALPADLSNAQLLLAGRPGWRYRPILEAAACSPAADRIRVLGPVSPGELAGLLAAAMVLAYPSLYEGFGLPVVEAFAAGVPVLTSDRSSLPEVAGDAAVQVNPERERDIREGLERLMRDGSLRADLTRRGRERAAVFSWATAAQSMLEVYRLAAAARHRGRGC